VYFITQVVRIAAATPRTSEADEAAAGCCDDALVCGDDGSLLVPVCARARAHTRARVLFVIVIVLVPVI